MGRLIAGSSLNGGSMKITYIHHSAFLAETEHACLLFDYFKGSLPKLPEGKRLYIFASHRHPDHFSKVIFDMRQSMEIRSSSCRQISGGSGCRRSLRGLLCS